MSRSCLSCHLGGTLVVALAFLDDEHFHGRPVGVVADDGDTGRAATDRVAALIGTTATEAEVVGRQGVAVAKRQLAGLHQLIGGATVVALVDLVRVHLGPLH